MMDNFLEEQNIVEHEHVDQSKQIGVKLWEESISKLSVDDLINTKMAAFVDADKKVIDQKKFYEHVLKVNAKMHEKDF